MIEISEQEKERFHRYYHRLGDDECWPWKMSLDGHGYGQMKAGGKKHVASRIAYLLHHGAQPGDMMVCHSCDNPACVNPGHLWLGTGSQNQIDCEVKKRRKHAPTFGSRNARAVISEKDVPDILEKMARGETNKAIARVYGVTHSTISLIRRGKSWGHVARPDPGHKSLQKYDSLR